MKLPPSTDTLEFHSSLDPNYFLFSARLPQTKLRKLTNNRASGTDDFAAARVRYLSFLSASFSRHAQKFRDTMTPLQGGTVESFQREKETRKNAEGVKRKTHASSFDSADVKRTAEGKCAVYP